MYILEVAQLLLTALTIDSIPVQTCTMQCVKRVYRFAYEFRVVGVTGMIEPKIGRKIVKNLIIKWDPEVDLGCLVYES